KLYPLCRRMEICFPTRTLQVRDVATPRIRPVPELRTGIGGEHGAKQRLDLDEREEHHIFLLGREIGDERRINTGRHCSPLWIDGNTAENDAATATVNVGVPAKYAP